jgi:hypothetical protein
MAKRPSDEMDPFDDPFDNEIDDSDIENLRIPDTDDPFDDIDDTDIPIDDEETPKRPKESTGYRPRPTVGQMIVGAIQVIVFAAIFLAIFLALGFGAVFGGQKVGLVPTRAPGGTGPLIALLPTAGAAQPQNSGNQPTAAPQGAPTTVPTPVATTDTSCSKAADWWNDPQVQSAYQYFAGQALNDTRSSDKVPALLVQMKIRRDFVANYQPNGKPLDACLNDAQAALLKGFDATIEAARAIGAKDATALATQQDNATKAYQDLAAALGKFGVSVNLTPVAPTSGA